MKLKIALFCCCVLVMLNACTEDKATNQNAGEPNQFMSFAHSAYSSNVNCSQLVAEARTAGKYTSVKFVSSSTKMEFLIYFPSDSSTMQNFNLALNRAIIAKGIFSLTMEDDNYGFAMGFKVPMSASALAFAYSQDFVDLNVNYNQVKKIEYISSDLNFAVFEVSGNYKYESIHSDNSASKLVSGDYKLRFKTNKK